MADVATREVVAYLSNEDSPTIRNPIHSTVGGQQFGFSGALVGGVTVYGWAAEAVIETLGASWLDFGWAEIAFKRPVYPGEALVIRLSEDDEPGLALTVEGSTGDVRIAGRVGLGNAPWFGELSEPETLSPSAIEITTTKLTLADAPVGRFLLPVPMAMSPAECRAHSLEKQRSSDGRFVGARPQIHPAAIAGFETMLIYGQFDFSLGIHVSSKVQHLARADAAAGYMAVGRFIDAFEKRGRHYGTVDGSLVRDGKEYARAHQTFIFAIEGGRG